MSPLTLNGIYSLQFASAKDFVHRGQSHRGWRSASTKPPEAGRSKPKAMRVSSRRNEVPTGPPSSAQPAHSSLLPAALRAESEILATLHARFAQSGLRQNAYHPASHLPRLCFFDLEHVAKNNHRLGLDHQRDRSTQLAIRRASNRSRAGAGAV